MPFFIIRQLKQFKIWSPFHPIADMIHNILNSSLLLSQNEYALVKYQSLWCMYIVMQINQTKTRSTYVDDQDNL